MEKTAKKKKMVKKIDGVSLVAAKVLVEPWITEAATIAAEKNKYIFKITDDATKTQVKKAIEELYGVGVKSVNTVTTRGKARNRGRIAGWKSGHKKAIVTLFEGESINLFEA